MWMWQCNRTQTIDHEIHECTTHIILYTSSPCMVAIYIYSICLHWLLIATHFFLHWVCQMTRVLHLFTAIQEYHIIRSSSCTHTLDCLASFPGSSPTFCRIMNEAIGLLAISNNSYRMWKALKMQHLVLAAALTQFTKIRALFPGLCPH